MDTFFEQLITIKKDGKALAAIIGIWFLAFIILFLLFTYLLTGLSFLLACGILYGAYWLSSKLNVEFEYIITNVWMDIDKIINKSARTRILGFDLQKVTRLEKYNPAFLNNINKKDVVFACNPDGENVYFMVAEKSNGGSAYLVFAPDKKIQTGIKKFAPRFLTNSVFD